MFDNYFLSSSCRVPSPISPMNRVVQPKVKVKSQFARSARWYLGTNSAFTLGPRKTTENLDWVGQSQDLPDANWLLASSPALNTPALTLVPICAGFFPPFFFCTRCFNNYFYVCTILINTKPCITPAEGMNTYMNKYAYTYSYICICDSLIIGNLSIDFVGAH
jgi:hypothetical protein